MGLTVAPIRNHNTNLEGYNHGNELECVTYNNSKFCVTYALTQDEECSLDLDHLCRLWGSICIQLGDTNDISSENLLLCWRKVCPTSKLKYHGG